MSEILTNSILSVVERAIFSGLFPLIFSSKTLIFSSVFELISSSLPTAFTNSSISIGFSI